MRFMVKQLKTAVTMICVAAVIFICIGCSQTQPELKRFEAEFLILFNTATKIVGYAQTKEQFSEFSQMVYDELKAYHELYDVYKDYDGVNNIKTINDNAGKSPVKVDRRIIDMLLFAKQQYKQTDGAVNVAMGSVLSIWHEYRQAGIDDPENAELPPIEALREASEHMDIEQLVIDEVNSTVFLADEHMRLDVGAIAKGYAVECVAKIVTEKGYTSALLSVGGNVKAVGTKPDGSKWKVGIQNPDIEDKDNPSIMNIELENMSLVTSGDYQRYYTVDGKRYNHIVDAATLYPAENFASVSVICENSGLADALSTALFLKSIEDGKAMVSAYKSDMGYIDVVWVNKDYSIVQLNLSE